MKFLWNYSISICKDAIELSRGRTNRLIKTLEEFDKDDLEVQALRRGQTFKIVSPLKKMQLGDLGEKSQSSTALSSATDKDDFHDQNVKEQLKNSKDQQKTKGAKNKPAFRLSMMNELDSD